MNAKKLLALSGVAVGGYFLAKYLAKPKAGQLGELGARGLVRPGAGWTKTADSHLANKAQGEAEKLYAKLQNLVVGGAREYAFLDPSLVRGFEDVVTRYKSNLDDGGEYLRKGDHQKAKYLFDALILDAPRMIAWVEQFVAGAPERLAALKRANLWKAAKVKTVYALPVLTRDWSKR